MSTVRALHDEAMALAQQSMLARERGLPERAIDLARQALDLETQAANQIDVTNANEPTRSILYKSAASLALQARDYDVAERLVARGLLGFPPNDVRADLEDVYEQVRFERSLVSRELILTGDQINLTMKGVSVGFGQILYKDFKTRVDALVALLDRTSRRQQAQPYQARGPAPKTIQRFQPVLGAPRAGSFIVTIGMAMMEKTTQSLWTDPSTVIGTVIEGIQLIQTSGEDRLRELIADEAYYTNFITMARELAPDGERVSRVFLESHQSSVDFTRTKTELSSEVVMLSTSIAKDHAVSLETGSEELTGRLVYADARSTGTIGLQTEERFFELVVPDGMDDLVRTHFNSSVTVVVEVIGNQRTLRSLQESEAEQ